MGCHSHLQRIFPTQGSNPSLPHCWRILYCLSHQGFVTNFPLIWKFNTTNIYLTVSVDQKSGHVLAGCLGFKVSHSVAKRGFSGGSDSKETTCSAGDPGLIPGLGRSPGKGNGYPLQYSCLENSMDRGAWQVAVPWGRKESDTTEQLSLSHGNSVYC